MSKWRSLSIGREVPEDSGSCLSGSVESGGPKRDSGSIRIFLIGLSMSAIATSQLGWKLLTASSPAGYASPIRSTRQGPTHRWVMRAGSRPGRKAFSGAGT